MEENPQEDYQIKNENIQKLMKDIGIALRGAMPEGWGFALMIFEYGERGALFYLADAQRADIVRVYREWLQSQEIEAGTDFVAADLLGRMMIHAVKDMGMEAWEKLSDETMNYLMRAQREHENAAPAFWKMMRDEGIIT